MRARRGWKLLSAGVVPLSLSLVASPARGAIDSCATKWSNFSAAQGGFVTNYTKYGQPIRDMEGNGDTSTGGSTPTGSSDLASGSPGSYPGPYSTTDFGYYPGTVPWNPADPTTLDDDFILFRWRLAADPADNNGNPPGLSNNKYNVLLDVDGDGYKEFWVLVDGNDDRVYLYYQDLNQQDIDEDLPYLVPHEFTALSQSITDGETQCTTAGAGTRLTSHTRSYAANDGTGDYFLEVQIPMSAFDDLNGNQILFPDSPVAYVYSTSEANTNPLQKDLMQQLQVGPLNLANPIMFGDVVTPNGAPMVAFTDVAGARSDFYIVGDDAYIQVVDRLANTNPGAPDSLVVTVSDPATGDDELVTLWETGNGTGVFSNVGGFCTPTQTNPASPPQAWLAGLAGTGGVVDGTFTLVYSSFLGFNYWSVTAPGGGTSFALAGFPYSNAGVSFTLYEDAPTLGPPPTTLSFCSHAADRLVLTTDAVVDEQDEELRVVPGDLLHVTYTNAQSVTVSDTIPVLGTSGCSGTAMIGFTRADGQPATDFKITASIDTSDRLYVTVVSQDANTSPWSRQTISVVLSGNDALTLSLTETGWDTGVFRNLVGVPTRVANGVADRDDATVWEDVDAGVITATYTRAGCPPYTTTAPIFATSGGGDVSFTDQTGAVAVATYTVDDDVWVTVADSNLAAGAGCTVPPQVTIEARAPDGTLHDTETLTLAETSPGSHVWRNTASLPTSRWVSGVSQPGVLEGLDGDTISVSYVDCNDGDLDTTNDDKTDSARFNAPALVINRVLFAPDAAVVGCQTEMVEIYNSASEPVSLQGYRLTDELPDDDSGLSYDFPDTVSDIPLVLLPGQKALLSLSGTLTDFFGGVDGTGQFFLFDPGSSSSPSAYLGEADQLTLYDANGVAVDFVAWSNTASNTLDWINDDSSAVTASLWGDNQYRQAVPATDYAPGSAMMRLSDGFDRDLPLDWTFATSADTTCSTVLAAATRVTLLGLRTDRSGRIEFRTATQRGTLGFNVWATSRADGPAERLLSAEPIPARGIDHFGPVDYEAAIEPFSEEYVLLEELERGGQSRWMGPFPVGDAVLAAGLEKRFEDVLRARGLSARRRGTGGRQLAGSDLDAGGHQDAAANGDAAATRDAAPRGEASRIGPVQRRRGWGSVRHQPGMAVTIDTAAAGVVTLGIAELEAGGLDRRLLRSLAQLQLTSLGRSVPFEVLPAGAGIRFRAEQLRTDFADRNVYVLAAPGAAPHRQVVPLTSLGPALEPGLHRVEQEVYYAPFVPQGVDPWFWDSAYEGWSPSLAFDLTGLTPTAGTVIVRLHLSTVSEHAHSVEATINGLAVGSLRWSGPQPAVLEGTVDGSALREAGNLLQVAYSGEPHDGMGGVIVDALDLGVRLLPAAPVEATVQPWTPSTPGGRGVEYLVIAPAELAEPARRLVAAKAAGGLRARLVTAEQAYSLYSGGIPEPNAIGRLILDAGESLRSVLLLGDDSMDPLDHTGLGRRSLVPSLYGYDGVFGYVPSENRYADRDEDGVPDVAIGRLPAASPAEAELLVDKVVRQAELLQEAGGHQAFAVDNRTAGDFDFLGAAGQASAALAGGAADAPQTWAVIGSGPLAEVREALAAGLRRGGIVHYFGHGADEFWADERLLDLDGARAQAGSGRAGVLFAWTCSAQWYVSPFGQGIDESLLLAPDGGALAAFGPSGVTRPYVQQAIALRVYEGLRSRLPLGEAIRRAKADTIRADPSARPVVEGFNLLGDPDLRLPR